MGKNRSFDSVDYKLLEADFFLEKLIRSELPDEVNFYFSAFVSAARSVTWVLQAVMKGVPGFEDWYARKQTDLRKHGLAKVFVELRNQSVKTGEWMVRTSESHTAASGERHIRHFMYLNTPQGEKVVNVGDSATELMTSLTTMIQECYERFGTVIDPDKYYTRENLDHLGLTIEDVEESLGFPRGWTAVTWPDGHSFSHEDVQYENRLRLLKRNIPKATVKPLFAKYERKESEHG